MRRLAVTIFAIAVLASGCSDSTDSDRENFTPTAVSGLVSKLRAGQSGAVLLTGDSTGNNRGEWFCTTMDWLGGQFPAHSISHLAWNRELQSWESTFDRGGPGCSVQTGSSGDRHLVTSTTGYASIANNAAMNITGDVDIRAKVAPDQWAGPVPQTVAAKFGAPGDRSWRLQVGKAGRVVLTWSGDGTAIATAVSTFRAPFPDGEPGWIRGTLGIDKKSARSTVTFYFSANGAEWKRLGEPVIVPGATSIATSTHNVEIGTHTGGADPLIGKNYYVEVRNGIDGSPVVILDMDSATDQSSKFTDFLGNAVELVGGPRVVGAPGLAVFNGSVPGEIAEYANDEARFQKLVPVPVDVAFVSFGHNYGTVPTMRQSYDQLTNSLTKKWPAARIVVVAQSPQAPPRTAVQISAHAARMVELIELAKKRRFGLVNAYSPMAVDPARYVGEDGLHMAQAGNLLWRDQAVDLFKTALNPVGQ